MASGKKPARPFSIDWPIRSDDRILRKDPWKPLVLSLDGGGIRGLSSLIILKHLMEKIDVTEREAGDNSGARLPCHYFDFIVGTSTGGLIAIMLGRLRMSVDECITAYKDLGSYVFSHRRWWRLTKYDHRRLKESIRSVISAHCKDPHEDDDGDCVGDCLLRQWDWSHHEGPFKNHTCKVVLVAQREKPRKTLVRNETHLFRTYDHLDPEPQLYGTEHPDELNPGLIFTDPTKIWEACRATSAAPLYFNKKRIMNFRYMDGGVGKNNPALLATNEALQMDKSRGRGPDDISVMISVGTGQPKAQSRFGTGIAPLFKLLKYMRKTITDTQEAERATALALRGYRAPYYRFDVPSPGLSKMKLDECKVVKIKRKTGNTPQSNRVVHAANGQPVSSVPNAPAAPNTAPGASSSTGSSTAGKYENITYRKIEEVTAKYCGPNLAGRNMNVDAQLKEAAEVLVYYRRRRQHEYPDEWELFATDPTLRPGARPGPAASGRPRAPQESAESSTGSLESIPRDAAESSTTGQARRPRENQTPKLGSQTISSATSQLQGPHGPTGSSRTNPAQKEAEASVMNVSQEPAVSSAASPTQTPQEAAEAAAINAIQKPAASSAASETQIPQETTESSAKDAAQESVVTPGTIPTFGTQESVEPSAANHG